MRSWPPSTASSCWRAAPSSPTTGRRRRSAIPRSPKSTWGSRPANNKEHDPEKHALGLRPDGWKPVFGKDHAPPIDSAASVRLSSDTAMALLEVNSLTAFYGDFQALYGVSLAVDEGQAVAVIGAN